MRSAMAALVMLDCARVLLAPQTALARSPNPSSTPISELSRVAKLISETRHLDVVVIGTGSSISAGPGGTGHRLSGAVARGVRQPFSGRYG